VYDLYSSAARRAAARRRRRRADCDGTARIVG
jgi:hypothetical protein